MEDKLKINFALKKGVKSSKLPIRISISFGYKEINLSTGKESYKPVVLPTGYSVEPAAWDELNGYPYNVRMRAKLVAMEEKVRSLYENMILEDKELTYDSVKSEVEVKIFGKKKVTIKKVRLVEFIRDVLPEHYKLAKGTKAHYMSFANRIEEYEKKIGKQLYSNDVNRKSWNDFMDFMRERESVEKMNSMWNVYKNFKSVLNKINEVYKIPVFNPTDELQKDEKLSSVDEDKSYLTYEQLIRLMKYKPHSERLKNVKLIFMTLAFTGCRWSDVFKIRPEHVFEKKGIVFSYAHIITQKGGKQTIIPILKPLMGAFEENGFKMPQRVANGTFNDDVKILFKECGFTDEEILTYTDKRGKKVIERRQLWECISSHTGRRSFITNLINFIPFPMLCKITTHDIKDKSIVFLYNKISHLENAFQFVSELKRLRKAKKYHFILDLV